MRPPFIHPLLLVFLLMSLVGVAQTRLYHFNGTGAEAFGAEHFGKATAVIGDVNGDGHPDFAISAYRVLMAAGDLRVYSGVDGGLIHDIQGTGEGYGASVAGLGDVNGDGVPDFTTGAQNGGPTNAGQVFVYSGATGAVIHTLESGQASGDFGTAVAAAGDVNNDGTPDVLVGSADEKAWVMSGSDGAILHAFTDGTLSGFGQAVTGIGDVNADDHDDIAVGAFGSGVVKVYSGQDGSLLQTLSGVAGDFGDPLASGDVDNDGTPDLLVGPSGAADSVRVYSGADWSLLHTITGTGGQTFGQALSVGKVDGDNFGDIVIGDRIAGKAWVYSGANGAQLFQLTGEADVEFGESVAVLGDINGDGIAEIAVGIPGDDALNNNSGAASVFSMSNQPSLVSFSSTSSATAEDIGSHSIMLTLQTAGGGHTLADITVDVIDLGTGTATAGSDYSFATTTVTFPANAANGTTICVPLPIIDDALAEGNEFANFALSNATGPGAVDATSLHRVLIGDDDDAAGVIHVDKNVVGGSGDGSSWANALPHLQDALALASDGDELWVAAATYSPDEGSYRGFSDEHLKSIGFYIVDGVSLFGGFSGSETARAQRDWAANPTILNGDVAGDDASLATFDSLGMSTRGADNCRVATAMNNVVLDGFVVEHGSIGLRLQGVDVSVHNCIFRENLGAIYGTLSAWPTPETTIQDCEFYNNSSGNSYASCIDVSGSNLSLTHCQFHNNEDVSRPIWMASGTVAACTFRDNESAELIIAGYRDSVYSNCDFLRNTVPATSGYGGIVRVEATTSIINCRFINNETPHSLIYTTGIQADGLQVINSLFAGNGAAANADMTNLARLELWEDGGIDFVNCTFADNRVMPANDLIDAIFTGADQAVSIANSIAWNNGSSVITSSGPTISLPNNSVGTDPLFADAAGRDYRLQSGSPAISLGDSTLLPADFADLDDDANLLEPLPLDLNLRTRVQGTLDAGALEHEPLGTISGRVWHDSDQDGQQQAGSEGDLIEAGVVSLTVNIRDAVSDAIIATAVTGTDPSYFATPATGAAGTFVVSGLYPGSYVVEVDSLGPRPFSPQNVGPDASDSDVDASGRSAAITLVGNTVTIDAGIEPTLLYVDKNVVGGVGDGSSWPNAFVHLQDALEAAQFGDELWVAAATYKPDEGSDRGLTPTELQNTGFLVGPRVSIYGGFQGNSHPAGGETSRAERNWTLYPTILNGDIAGDDAPLLSVDSLSMATRGPDNFRVVTTESEFRLDGLVIEHGNRGLVLGRPTWANSSAAASLVVANCVFRENIGALTNGEGWVHLRIESCEFHSNSGGTSTTSCVNGSNNREFINVWVHDNVDWWGAIVVEGPFKVFENCTFENNYSEIYIISANGSYSLYKRCVFRNNSVPAVHGYGGLVRIGWHETFANCEFANNETPYSLLYTDWQSDFLTVINSKFTGNGAPSDAAFDHLMKLDVRVDGSIDIINCTIADNRVKPANDLVSVTAASGDRLVNIFNSIDWNNGSAQIVTPGPNIVLQDNLTGVDPLFADSANGDYSLGLGSPAIDSGDNAHLPADSYEVVYDETAPNTTETGFLDLDDDGDVAEPLSRDLAEAARVQGGQVDIGAIESTEGTISGIVWHDIDRDGLNEPGFAELGLPGFTVYIDTNDNQTLDEGEPSTISGAEGSFSFAGQSAGIYNVRIVLAGNWVQSAPLSSGITLQPGATGNVEFGAYELPNRHFPEVAGDPSAESWLLYLQGATLDGAPLAMDDEIAIYDGDNMVGSFRLDEVLTPQNAVNTPMTAWASAGYTAGNAFSFRAWDASEEQEVTWAAAIALADSSGAYTGASFPGGDGEFSFVTLNFVSDPAVGGVNHVGDELSTTIGNDPAFSYSYQWQRADDAQGGNLADIPGATSASYTPVLADNGKYLRVQVTATPVSRAATTLNPAIFSDFIFVDNAEPVIAEGDTIAVTMDEDSDPIPFSLTLHASDSDGDPLSWYQDGAPIGLGSSKVITYSPAADFAGTDGFTVIVHDGLNGSDHITVTVTVNPRNDPPVNTAVPTITGTVAVGSVLSASPGTWNDDKDSPPGTISYSYQWQVADYADGRDARDLPGVTDPSHTVSADGGFIRVVVTATDDGSGAPGPASSVAESAFVQLCQFCKPDGDPQGDNWAVQIAGFSFDGTPAEPGDELAIFDGGTIVGSLMIKGSIGPAFAGSTVLTAFADLTTAGAPMTFVARDHSSSTSYSFHDLAFIPTPSSHQAAVFPATAAFSVIDIDFRTLLRLDITASGAGSGAVSVNGNTQSLPFSGQFPLGTEMNIVALPNVGSCGPEPQTFTLSADSAIDLAFTESYSLAVEIVGPGSIELQGVAVSDSAFLPCAATADLSAVFDSASAVFAGWSGDAAGNTTNVTIPVDGDKSVTATFHHKQAFDLAAGYHFISSHIQPLAPSLAAIFAAIIDDIAWIKSERGAFFRKLDGEIIDNIGPWTSTEGYLIKLNNPVTFDIIGNLVSVDTPIALYRPYHFAPYFPLDARDAQTSAFAGILNHIDFVKNSAGNFLRQLEGAWVNNIGNALPGEAYLVHVESPITLSYSAARGSRIPQLANTARSGHFPAVSGDPSRDIWTLYLADANIDGQPLQPGDEIAIFGQNLLVGSFELSETLTDERRSDNFLTAWSRLSDGPGYQAGNSYRIFFWDESEGREVGPVAVSLRPGIDTYQGQVFPDGDGQASIVELSYDAPIDELRVAQTTPLANAGIAVEEGQAHAFAITIAGGTPPYQYSWSIDGNAAGSDAPALSYAPDFLVVAHPARSRTVAIACEVTDDVGASAATSWANVLVHDVDQPPPAPDLALLPATAFTSDDLRIDILSQAADPDGDAITGYETNWQLIAVGARAVIPGELAASETRRGDNWRVVVAPLTNPYADFPRIGPNIAVAEIAIENSPPSAEHVQRKTTPGVDLLLQLPATDPDAAENNDSLSYAITSVASFGEILNFDAATGNFLYRAQALGVEQIDFTVSDSSGVSASGSVSIDIAGWSLALEAPNAQQLRIGMHTGAADGIDELDVHALPALRDQPHLYTLTLGEALASDIRASASRADWLFVADTRNAMGDTILNWHTSEVPEAGLFVAELDGNQEPIEFYDMRALNRLVLAPGSIRQFVIYYGVVSFDLALSRGWSTISLPIDPLHPSAAVIFGDAPVSEVLRWGTATQTYEVADNLEAGRGYYLHNNAGPVTLTLLGRVVPPVVLPLGAEWNLIGPTAAPPYAHVEPSEMLPAGIESLIWWLDKDLYRSALSLHPGIGYWVFSQAP